MRRQQELQQPVRQRQELQQQQELLLQVLQRQQALQQQELQLRERLLLFVRKQPEQ